MKFSPLLKKNWASFLLISVIVLVANLPACIRQQAPEESSEAYQPVTEILGKEETCVRCHGEVNGFVAGHNPGSIGCASCHLGNPRSLDKDTSHAGMVRIPGNLANAAATCGNKACHPELIDRVSNSLMTTMAGVVSTNRHVFNPSAPARSNTHISEIREDTPSDSHLRQLCASCHLGREKTEFGPVDTSSRGGGCTACHLNYSDPALADLQDYIEGRMEDSLITVHPALSLEVTNDHCFGCHSRSGRISTNYEGWHETTLELLPENPDTGFMELPDGRIFEKYSADIHHDRGLDCIDCHISMELMGDGNQYRHKAEALKVQCADCHIEGPVIGMSLDELSDEEKKILNIRGIETPAFLSTRKSGDAILNSFITSTGKPFLVGKNTMDTFELKQPAAICRKDAVHARLTCDACHTSWAPQCLGCHTGFDPLVSGFDLLERKKVKGKWNESIGVFLADPPPLGVVSEELNDGGRIERIRTFIAGMVFTLDHSGFPGHEEDSTEFRRLFAPVSAHTTMAKGRTCKSCHANPLALGYGRGEFMFEVQVQEGRWTFEPDYVYSAWDGLPEDAWIPFMGERDGMTTTRSVARPFSIEEQQKILAVGACLTCHEEHSDVMMRSLDGFEDILAKRDSACVRSIFD